MDRFNNEKLTLKNVVDDKRLAVDVSTHQQDAKKSKTAFP
jgi:hypothetical protein